MCIKKETRHTRCGSCDSDITIVPCNDIYCRSDLIIDIGLRAFRVDLRRTDRAEVNDFCRTCRINKIFRDSPRSYHLNQEFQTLQAEEVLAAAYTSQLVVNRIVHRAQGEAARHVATALVRFNGRVNNPQTALLIQNTMWLLERQEELRWVAFQHMTETLPNTNGEANSILVGSAPRINFNSLANQREDPRGDANVRLVDSFARVDINSLNEEDRTCYICQRRYGETPEETEPPENPVRLPCRHGHVFGYDCMITCLNEGHNSCPLCRTRLR